MLILSSAYEVRLFLIKNEVSSA